MSTIVDNSWRSWRAANFYKDINEIATVNANEWKVCPCCKEKPRLWIFDNGEYAKCKCQDTYEASAASGISIWAYHKLNNGNMSGWNHNNLRDNWNNYVDMLNSEQTVPVSDTTDDHGSNADGNKILLNKLADDK